MESEYTKFSPSQSEPGEADSRDTTYSVSSQDTQTSQEAQITEGTQNETSSASKRRRHRPTRSSARQSHTSAAEHANEDANHTEEAAQSEEQSEAPESASALHHASAEETPEARASTEASMDTTSDLAATTPASNLWQAESQLAPQPATLETVWGFNHWHEQPPADWNPFIPRAPESLSTSASEAALTDTTSDFEMAPLVSPEAETPPASDTEMMAPTAAQEAALETPPAPAAPEQPGEKAHEPVRAPLSGVEVRPPRRYRFDRPRPATHEAPPREALQEAAPPKPAKQQAMQPEEAPAETPPAQQDLRAAMERELTETPEVEADVVAAEELARATQAALEEEVAEALETFAQKEPPASSRAGGRRRRRRASSPAATPEAAEKAPMPPPLVAPDQPYAAPAPQAYQVANGLQHIGQPQSPFAGPEPSSARGFGPVPRGVAMPAERGVRMPHPERTVDNSNVPANQLAMIFTQAIQQQTDRLLMELRRSQGTPSMTVNFPPMPSNERIGIFVDVANLLYSARNMRIAIDFGRMLDFLRGNRRLVRAHAYCPTSPDPRAEQMFLDAVKGLGYRITTKNYKTFSSGAKKADLDLDLCMDIVRLVDAGAVDCISLVSGDSDFLPLLEYCSDHGVRVEVAAFDEATASILRQSCDLFINLSMVEEIRA
jgi:uncharacterized LabA/DUF88 family protein